MQVNSERSRSLVWIMGGAVLLVLLAVFFWPYRAPEGEETALEREPQVEVVGAGGDVQEMGIESYVAGVVAGEMLPDWPKAAYAAQALVARTFALQYLESHQGRRISTDFEEAQAYQPDKVTDVIREAVEETRGQVITYQGEPIHAWFHAYAGGQTASAREGLAFEEDEPPYIKSITLEANALVPQKYQHWTLTLPLEEVQQALTAFGISVGPIEEIRAEHGPTGRITQVLITSTDGQVTPVTGPDFRAALDPERMKSAKVSRFEVEGGQLHIEGTGYGHGVGLSQWDALVLAREGKSAAEIVRTFYDGVTIEQRWE